MQPIQLDSKTRRRRLAVFAFGGVLLAGSIALILNEHKLTQNQETKSQRDAIIPERARNEDAETIAKTSGAPPLTTHERDSSLREQDPVKEEDSGNPPVEMADVFDSIGDEYLGNPLAFNSKYGNTRVKGLVTFQFLMGPDENGYYTMSFSEYNAPCAFAGSQSDSLAKLRSGDKVSITGLPHMFGPGIVMLGDCKIID
jgi:hypothetical protein